MGVAVRCPGPGQLWDPFTRSCRDPLCTDQQCGQTTRSQPVVIGTKGNSNVKVEEEEQDIKVRDEMDEQINSNISFEFKVQEVKVNKDKLETCIGASFFTIPP